MPKNNKVTLINNILKCKTLSITGMAKNTGKTVTLNFSRRTVPLWDDW